MTARLRHVSAALVTAAALVVALTLLLEGPDPRALARWLGRHGGAEYPLWIGWSLAAPLLLAGGWCALRWSPWPWVTVVALHLVSLVAAAARFSRLVPGWGWVLLAATIVVGLVSVAAAVSARRTAPG